MNQRFRESCFDSFRERKSKRYGKCLQYTGSGLLRQPTIYQLDYQIQILLVATWRSKSIIQVDTKLSSLIVDNKNMVIFQLDRITVGNLSSLSCVLEKKTILSLRREPIGKYQIPNIWNSFFTRCRRQRCRPCRLSSLITSSSLRFFLSPNF